MYICNFDKCWVLQERPVCQRPVSLDTDTLRLCEAHQSCRIAAGHAGVEQNLVDVWNDRWHVACDRSAAIDDVRDAGLAHPSN